MGVYAHWVQQSRSNSLAAFLVAEERDGCEMVATPSAVSRKRVQLAD
jgi:hypothetical protein